MQDDAGKQQLLSQVLTQEHQIECFMRERSRSLAVKVQQAAMWLPIAAHPQHDSSDQQQQQQQQHLVAAPMASSVRDGRQQKTGYVTICGIALPCKQLDALSTATAQTALRFIHTAAVEDNLKAAALALCQNRPLLLEGPPGGCCVCLSHCLCCFSKHVLHKSTPIHHRDGAHCVLYHASLSTEKQ